MNILNTAEQSLLELIKIGIGHGTDNFDFTALTADDWNEVIKESQLQTVQLLAFDATKKITSLIPDDLNMQWFQLAAATISQNHRVLDAQNKLVDLLEKNNISYIILKGFASGLYYPDFEKRAYGDVDFLVAPEHIKTAESLLLNEGYSKREIAEDVCHLVFIKNGVHFELHKEIGGIPDGKYGQIFRLFFKNATQEYNLNDNPSFHNPKSEILAVILLLHTVHHMLDQGLGLRHLCDWACFVDRTYKEPFWKEKLLPLLKKTGTLKFAAAVTKTSSLYLGTACPDWANKIDEELCAQIIRDIFELGNFGKKNITRSVSSRMISKHGKDGVSNRKFSYISDKVNGIIKDVSKNTKCKPLIPFAMVWRFIKTAFLMISGKRISVLKTNSYANERKSVYEKLELYK